MAQQLSPQKISAIGTYGLIRDTSVDDVLIPDGAVTEAKNFHFDRIGAATVRPGLTALGATVLTARPAVGMHNVQSKTAVVVFSNGSSSTIYAYDGSAWGVSLDGGTASVRIRFVDFGSYVITPNFIYNSYSSMRFWDGGERSWKNTGNPINPQNMWGYNPQLLEVFKSKVYASGDPAYPSRLFFSSVISSTGNITWSPTVDWVDINPGDGEDNTALKRYSLELLFFKPNYIYRFRTTGVDPDPLIKVGTRSHESVVEGKKGLYFHHETGLYRYTGGYPSEISRPINDLVEAIPYSQYNDIVAWNDNDHVYWAIGNITIAETHGSTTIKNCVLRYTESSDVWTVYSYAHDVRAAMTFNSGSTLTRVVATDHGVVATQNSGTTDLGEPIKFRMRTKFYSLGEISESKIIQELVAVCEKAQATEIFYQTDENQEWKTIGTLTKLVNFLDNLSIRCFRIRFLVTGTSRHEAPVFKSIEIVRGLNEGRIHHNG